MGRNSWKTFQIFETLKVKVANSTTLTLDLSMNCLVVLLHGVQRPGNKGRLCWFGHGGCEQKCRIGVESWYTAVMNKPWRIFCRPGTRFCELSECRGTRFMASRSQVKVQRVL
jgi:hypothetical protein